MSAVGELELQTEVLRQGFGVNVLDLYIYRSLVLRDAGGKNAVVKILKEKLYGLGRVRLRILVRDRVHQVCVGDEGAYGLFIQLTDLVQLRFYQPHRLGVAAAGQAAGEE